jgi:pyroglutamyl-peptidase
MNKQVLAARPEHETVVLVTGFGAFPGAPKNPTQSLMKALAPHEGRLARLGIRLERRVLPVVYGEIGPKLKALMAELAPDAVLHFGLASRRKAINIETRAVNRLTMLHPDATGRRSDQRQVLPGSSYVRSSKLPTRGWDSSLRRAGFTSVVSIDAGDYVCNQTFYLSLAMAEGTHRQVGFIHVPKCPVSTLTPIALHLILALIPRLRRKVSTFTEVTKSDSRFLS